VRPGTKDPVRLRGAIARVVSELGHGPAAATLRIAEHWEAAVGREVARHAEPMLLAGDTLEVKVTSSAWSQQLSARKGEILAALSEALGPDAPKDLRFRL
jgi:predicted nucleic acid-binding Zn ribbon protein